MCEIPSIVPYIEETIKEITDDEIEEINDNNKHTNDNTNRTKFSDESDDEEIIDKEDNKFVYSPRVINETALYRLFGVNYKDTIPSEQHLSIKSSKCFKSVLKETFKRIQQKHSHDHIRFYRMKVVKFSSPCIPRRVAVNMFVIFHGYTPDKSVIYELFVYDCCSDIALKFNSFINKLTRYINTKNNKVYLDRIKSVFARVESKK